MQRLSEFNLGDIVSIRGEEGTIVATKNDTKNILIAYGEDKTNMFWGANALHTYQLQDNQCFNSLEFVIQNYKKFWWWDASAPCHLVKQKEKQIIIATQLCMKCLLSAPHTLPNLKDKYMCKSCVAEYMIDNNVDRVLV